MVPPCAGVRSSGHSQALNSRWTTWPNQCTDTMHRCPVEPSGAEEHSLWEVLCSLNVNVRWTAGWFLKRRFIWCWSRSFGVSLYDLNASVGSSGAEEAKLWPLLLPNPKASDEPLPIPSVHPTVSFDFFGRWTHPTNVVLMASVHPMLWLEF
jgi:hypothetical protein